MPIFKIEFKPRALKDIEALNTEDRLKVMSKIYLLKDNPFPEGSKKLETRDDLWRDRVGDYRIIYQVQKKVLLVLVVRVGDRKDIYKNI